MPFKPGPPLKCTQKWRSLSTEYPIAAKAQFHYYKADTQSGLLTNFSVLMLPLVLESANLGLTFSKSITVYRLAL